MISMSMMFVSLKYAFKSLASSIYFLGRLNFLPFQSWTLQMMLCKLSIAHSMHFSLSKFLSFSFRLKNLRILEFFHSLFYFQWRLRYSNICINKVLISHTFFHHLKQICFEIRIFKLFSPDSFLWECFCMSWHWSISSLLLCSECSLKEIIWNSAESSHT